MPRLVFKQWENGSVDEVELEVCRDAFCFELRDKLHRVHVFYSEWCERGSVVLDVDLQKEKDYKKYVKKIFEFDLPQKRLDEHQQFFDLYKFALNIFNGIGSSKVHAKWEKDGINVDIEVVLEKGAVRITLTLLHGPNRLHYYEKSSTDNVADELKKIMIRAVGLYAVIEEYGRQGKI
jgi:hypothetical protein